MSDPFFQEIDWNALENGYLDPPVILCKGGNVDPSPKNDELMLFENDDSNE